MFKVSFWKCVAVLAFAKRQHVKKNNDVGSTLSTVDILKWITFQGIVLLQSWINIKFPFYWKRFGERKNMLKKNADVSDLVISRDVSLLKISNKNEPNSILTKFHYIIINLKCLRFICQDCIQRFFGDTIFWNGNFSSPTPWLLGRKKIISL